MKGVSYYSCKGLEAAVIYMLQTDFHLHPSHEELDIDYDYKVSILSCFILNQNPCCPHKAFWKVLTQRDNEQPMIICHIPY